MKINSIAGFLSLLLITNSYSAVTLEFQAGRAFDALGIPVPDGTPYALLVSTDDSFAGGFGLNEGLRTSGDASSVFSIGQTFSLGDVLGGDTVFGVGLFNGVALAGEPGLVSDVLEFELGTNGLVAGRKYAFYFFSGGGLVGDTITVGSEVGGVNSNRDEAGLQAMVIPAEGATIITGYATSDFGGSITDAQSTAVLIPEPSVTILGAVGILALLRRKR